MIEWKKKLGPFTIATGAVEVSPVINVVTFGQAERKVERKLREEGLFVSRRKD